MDAASQPTRCAVGAAQCIPSGTRQATSRRPSAWRGLCHPQWHIDQREALTATNDIDRVGTRWCISGSPLAFTCPPTFGEPAVPRCAAGAAHPVDINACSTARATQSHVHQASQLLPPPCSLQLFFQVIMNDNSPPASELSVSDDYSHYSNEYGTEASARSTLADLLERFTIEAQPECTLKLRSKCVAALGWSNSAGRQCWGAADTGSGGSAAAACLPEPPVLPRLPACVWCAGWGLWSWVLTSPASPLPTATWGRSW